MTERVDYLPPTHPHGYAARTEHALELAVLGIPTRFESNSTTVIERVEEAFGNWRVNDSALVQGNAHVLVRVVVRDATEDNPIAFRHHVTPDFRVILTTRGSVAVADHSRREVVAWVSPDLVRNRAQFRYGLLEASTMAVLTRRDRQPVHAAAVVQDGKALLLCAHSGTGKSTLAYSLARAGLQILCDDVVYVESASQLRLWGLPRFLHLTEDARRFFPELSDAAAGLLANGKRKIAIDLRERGFATPKPVAEPIGVCLIERVGSSSELGAASAADVITELTAELEDGFDLFADTIGPVAYRLAQTGAWRLKLGPDPAAGAALIGRLFQRDLRRPA